MFGRKQLKKDGQGAPLPAALPFRDPFFLRLVERQRTAKKTTVQQ